MAEGEGGAGSAGGAELAGGEGGGEGGGAVTTQAWVAAIEGIPDDLKADATINRYTNPVDALKGLVEHKKMALTRLPIPGKDAKPEEWSKVYDALGRPKTAAEYDFGLAALPDNADEAVKTARTEMIGRYAELFHPLGLNSAQAAALVKADVERMEAAVKAHNAKGVAEIAAVKAELGADYAPQMEAATKLYNQLFPDRTFADALDDHLGSAALLKGFMKLAKVAGEHQRVDGGGGELTPGGADASATLQAKQRDPTWREKFNNNDPTVLAEHARLLKAAQDQAVAAGGTSGSFVTLQPT